MASYCDEFSFDEVFEDPSYVQVSVNQPRYTQSFHEANEEEEKDETEDPEYEKIKNAKDMELIENGLFELDFMKDSMTEEELDRFWKEFPVDSYKPKSKVYPMYDLDLEEDECEFYFQREILAI